MRYPKILPSFAMLSSHETDTNHIGLDMPVVLQGLSKGAHTLFWKLISVRNPRFNIAQYQPTNIAERRALTKAYKELSDLKLIFRVCQGQYLISPLAYLPEPSSFPALLYQWEIVTQD